MSDPSPSEASRGATESPVRDAGSWAVLVVALVFAVVADLWTKHVAFERIAPAPVQVDRADVLALTPNLRDLIPPHEPTVVIPHVLEFTLVLNPGAVFGLGAGMRWVFVVFTLVAFVAGLWAFAKWTTKGDVVAHVGLAFLIGGGIGNLYDRLVFGCVRDFLHPLPGVHIGSWEVWPYVSNVADALLLIGIAGLMWRLWRTEPEKSG